MHTISIELFHSHNLTGTKERYAHTNAFPCKRPKRTFELINRSEATRSNIRSTLEPSSKDECSACQIEHRRTAVAPLLSGRTITAERVWNRCRTLRQLDNYIDRATSNQNNGNPSRTRKRCGFSGGSLWLKASTRTNGPKKLNHSNHSKPNCASKATFCFAVHAFICQHRFRHRLRNGHTKKIFAFHK